MSALRRAPARARAAAGRAADVARLVTEWQRAHGRHDLPWQRTRDPYRIWLSEVMLQQTRVASVLPYYARFLERFPDVGALARASLDEVLEHWSGLGYYSRARNLHECARRVAGSPGGAFPRTAAELARLPGIGASTAAAIAVFAYGERAAILDGNVKRVLCRCFGVEGFPGLAGVQRELWAIARRELPVRDVEGYTQGLMDLGATVCTRSRPACAQCPLRERCVALATGRTERLPAARPRREMPLREVRMYVFRHRGSVLLVRRPESGVWGGLWSLPEAAVPGGSEVERVPADAFGLRAGGARELPAFVHAFTHFRLRIRPLLVEAEPAALADSGAARWLALHEDDVRRAALPQPVKTMLLELCVAGARPIAARDGS